MTQVHIIIAEDNPRDFEFLEQLIKSWEGSCVVDRAPNGMAALELALHQEQPLLISDIQMPQMNGIELARNLWQRKPQARIVFWSQFKDEMYVRTLSRIVPPETVYGYILKSNPRDRILSAIQTVLLEEQCWIDPEVRKVQGRAGHSQTALSDIEFEALLDISLGLTDNLIAQRRYLSRRGVQSRLNSLYSKLGVDQEQFQGDKFGDAFNLRNRAVAVALRRGLINAFELEHEEKEFQIWLKRFKSGRGA
ncbi:MAG: response regulator transcription factor [Syntrophotalea acetylenica]|jgi:DNA-binding NarL/FixJ family response regulator|uniref:response regulator transcription factor n=1 Tax=Syntrophotalea TaxID=2812025 RepID=UPI00090BC661|nr:response regulator transcription factor [Syntrophotalea acetylenica]APG42723.1 response regulator [Syntrophotalea acetylenica]MDD4457085.1 response regulator transcription factor [Syntrophotalea acetylenica]MDY0262166.1 response regulator transcription factor [Syntrophotalea acetylenica]